MKKFILLSLLIVSSLLISLNTLYASKPMGKILSNQTFSINGIDDVILDFYLPDDYIIKKVVWGMNVELNPLDYEIKDNQLILKTAWMVKHFTDHPQYQYFILSYLLESNQHRHMVIGWLFATYDPPKQILPYKPMIYRIDIANLQHFKYKLEVIE